MSYDLLIRNGAVVDGTGAPRRRLQATQADKRYRFLIRPSLRAFAVARLWTGVRPASTSLDIARCRWLRVGPGTRPAARGNEAIACDTGR